MVRVSPPISPLECLMGGNVYVLEIVVRTIAPFSRYGQGAGRCLRSGVGGDTGDESTDYSLQKIF